MSESLFNSPLPARASASDAQVLDSYARDASGARGVTPLQVLYPRDRTEVQQIVREAARTRTPLVPVSSGPPHLRGDTVPTRAAVIVDFTQMNRVLRIDPVSRSVRVEPGVSFGELIPLLRAQGLRLSLPFLPRANKSVVASRLEREPTLIPKYQYDYMDPLLTLEVVYGDGSDFRTGSACGPGPIETLKADLVNPWGPGSIDYFRLLSAAQGTMGLVTWATTKAEVLPSLQRLFFLQGQNPGELLAPIDAMLRRRVLDECLVVNRQTLAVMLAQGGMTDFAALLAALPPWTAILCVAGYARRAEERVALYEGELLRIAGAAKIDVHRELPGVPGRSEELLELLSNAWQRSEDWRSRISGSSRELMFIAPMGRMALLIDTVGEALQERQLSLEEACVYLQPMVQGRGCHCELVFPCSADDPAALRRLQGTLAQAAERIQRAGGFFSRPYGHCAELVWREDPLGADALRRLKDIFDPQHLFNPGRLCL